MGKILYLECNSGISGDMTVGALLDLGADQETLKRALDSMGLEGYHLHFGRKEICGLDAFDFDVHLEEHKDKHGENHVHSHGEVHDHGHTDAHHHIHSHIHRNLYDVYEIIDRLDSNDHVKDLAKRMFSIVAEAEAKAHGLPIDQVHFHEVGAVDSIVDIVAAAVCLDDLDITDVVITKLNEGQGTIRCQHGILPVPVPAVMNIVQAHGLPLHITGIQGELVTPTGAAIAAAVRTGAKLPDVFTIKKTGMGAGKRNYEGPGMLRAMLIEEGGEDRDRIWKLETNIDDCTGESLGYTMERLMEAGARDVHYLPVYMKKNRPAYQLNVLCTEEDVERMEQIVFEETTTIGIRRVPMDRTILRRESLTVQTPLGEAKVKVCRYGGTERYFPEYDSVVSLCRAGKKHYQEVYQMVRKACGE